MAFLVLDRNHNGVVDNGLELFGNNTPLLAGGTAVTGYDALAELDLVINGGDENGSIGTEDRVWGALRLWIDANHDGICHRSELMTLEEAGILRLGYAYVWDRKVDRYGNAFRARSKALQQKKGDRSKEIRTYDVIFARLR